MKSYNSIVFLLLIINTVYVVSSNLIYDDYSSENIWLSMPDGIRLSVSLAVPISKDENEKFPVLLEYKPYRKDDSFYNYHQPQIFYLVRRGFIVAKVDIRGTGSSEGKLIEREYTPQELDDCEQVIQQLANHSRSNGRVGMYGLSWSGFNSLMMTTLRRPLALRAIFAAHASEDLYINDIHYMDGIQHQDEYIISVDHENALPASPDYVINDKWMKERFTVRPWMDVYLEQQLDGPFWRNHSIKYAYENLTIPVYLLGGYYDGYKDFATRIYENARHFSPKIKVVVGPFVHAMPEFINRNPGPGFDGKGDMVRWFNYWLKDINDTDIISEPDITLFIRTSLTTGFYRYESEWPISRQKNHRLFLSKEQKLIDRENVDNSEIDTLLYRPWIGLEGGIWWGSSLEDQKMFDKYCLIYESEIIQETIEIIGFVNVSLQVSSTARLAHWVVRLEDVDLNGQVWFITGGALNGAQRQTPPTYLEPNQIYTITFQLHFTTWTYFPGHRIRIAISNSMFPAFWPSPYAMNTSIYLNSSATFIDLPIVSPLSTSVLPPAFTQQQVSTSDILLDVFSGGTSKDYEAHTTDSNTTVSYQSIFYELLPNGCFISGVIEWKFVSSHLDPADVRWIGHGKQVYVFDMNGYSIIDDIPMKDELYPDVNLSIRRHFTLNTDFILYSDEENFYLDFNRTFFHTNRTEIDEPIKFIFHNKHKRQFQ